MNMRFRPGNEKSWRTHMQTDCPKEDMRDRKMQRNHNGRMRRMKVSGKIRLRKKSYLTQGTQNLPHLKARGKTVGTDKDREEERTQHKQKQVKHKQRFGEQEDSWREMREQKKPLAAVAHAQTPAGGVAACSPFHAAPAFGWFSWCISGPPASVLPPPLRSVRSEPFYHWWAARTRTATKSESSDQNRTAEAGQISACVAPTWSMKVSCLWIVLSYCSFCSWNFLLSSLSFSFSCFNVSSLCWALRGIKKHRKSTGAQTSVYVWIPGSQLCPFSHQCSLQHADSSLLVFQLQL